VERYAEVVPFANDREAVGAISEDAIELEGYDRRHRATPHELEDALPAFASCERLAGADAGVDDDRRDLKAAHGAVRADRGLLRAQADARSGLLFC
jgi:hypothetical protein